MSEGGGRRLLWGKEYARKEKRREEEMLFEERTWREGEGGGLSRKTPDSLALL